MYNIIVRDETFLLDMLCSCKIRCLCIVILINTLCVCHPFEEHSKNRKERKKEKKERRKKTKEETKEKKTKEKKTKKERKTKK